MLKKGFDNSVLHEDFVILDNNSKRYKLYSIPQVRQVFFLQWNELVKKGRCDFQKTHPRRFLSVAGSRSKVLMLCRPAAILIALLNILVQKKLACKIAIGKIAKSLLILILIMLHKWGYFGS